MTSSESGYWIFITLLDLDCVIRLFNLMKACSFSSMPLQYATFSYLTQFWCEKACPILSEQLLFYARSYAWCIFPPSSLCQLTSQLNTQRLHDALLNYNIRANLKWHRAQSQDGMYVSSNVFILSIKLLD